MKLFWVLAQGAEHRNLYNNSEHNNFIQGAAHRNISYL